jgi:hypothetical protein
MKIVRGRAEPEARFFAGRRYEPKRRQTRQASDGRGRKLFLLTHEPA